jgi:sugar phosphate isomerase/epimerase
VNPDGTTARSLGRDAWVETLSEVADAGFSLVELTDIWLKAGELSPSELHALSGASEESGLGLAAIALIRKSVIDAREWKANLEYTHRSIDAAAELSVPVVSIGLHEPLSRAQRQALWFWTERGAINDPDDRERWSTAVRRIRELADHADEVGVLLSLEMYEDTYLGTADSAVRLVEAIDRLNVGLNPDTGNLIRLHRPIDDWRATLEAVLPYTNYWHVKNYARDEQSTAGWYSTIPTAMSHGLIDYRWAVREAVASGFAGTFTCEHYGGDGLSVSAENHRYLRTILPTSTRTQKESKQ